MLAVNGVNGATGEYLLGPLELRDIAAIAERREPRTGHVRELQRWSERMSVEHLGPVEGIDPTDVTASGWGAIFPRHGNPAIRAALHLCSSSPGAGGNRPREPFPDFFRN